MDWHGHQGDKGRDVQVWSVDDFGNFSATRLLRALVPQRWQKQTAWRERNFEVLALRGLTRDSLSAIL